MARTLLASAAMPCLLGATAAFAAPPASLLGGLPASTKKSLAPLFTANAIGQTGLNGQIPGTPAELLDRLRQSLTKAGYAEQPIRTTVGAWGFSATWATPAGVTVDGTPQGQQAVLVTQATALAPGKLNLNIRFEAVAPIAQPSEPAQQQPATSQPSSGFPLPRGLF
jgi:hypothetical protein